MIFFEVYGAYYNTVAAVIKKAVRHPVSEAEIREIIEKHAFGESKVIIPEAIKSERWQLISKDGITPIKNNPSLPLSLLQKQWLKAVACDQRIRLFGDIDIDFTDVEPLFRPEDIFVFDRCNDGDNYSDENYIANFRLILDAIKQQYPLSIDVKNRRGAATNRIILPEYLEYSEKDDKFRLIGAGERFGLTINLGRIISCRRCDNPTKIKRMKHNKALPRRVILELTDCRNVLERVLLHFAHFKKTAERIDKDRYAITIHYDKEDETEVVIRVLSFGPLVKATAPEHFINLIKQRLISQKSCEQ